MNPSIALVAACPLEELDADTVALGAKFGPEGSASEEDPAEIELELVADL